MERSSMCKKYVIIFTIFFAVITAVFYFVNKSAKSNLDGSTLRNAEVVNGGTVEHKVVKHKKSEDGDGYSDYDYKVTWYQDMKVKYSVSDKPFYNNKRIELRSRTYDERPYNIRDNEVDLKYKTGDKFQVYVLNSDNSKFWLKDELEANAKVSEVFFIICLIVTIIGFVCSIVCVVKNK